MNTQDIINGIAERTGLTKKDTSVFLDGFIEEVVEVMKSGGKVRLSGFGNFEPRKRSARTGRNPQDGTPVEIPESKTFALKVSKKCKKYLNS